MNQAFLCKHYRKIELSLYLWQRFTSERNKKLSQYVHAEKLSVLAEICIRFRVGN